MNGVQFPVYMDQIDFPYFKRFSEKKIVFPKKEKVYVDNLKKEEVTKKYHVHSGAWLSFLPVFDKDIFYEDVVEKFKIYLLNNDAFLARHETGETGKVIGIDFTPAMIDKARSNAELRGLHNVEDTAIQILPKHYPIIYYIFRNRIQKKFSLLKIK